MSESQGGFNLLDLIGASLAIIGSCLSIVGTLINNLELDHNRAMEVWMISNPLLLLWGIGYLAGLWNGAVSVGSLCVMYLVFTVTNWYGLRKAGEA